MWILCRQCTCAGVLYGQLVPYESRSFRRRRTKRCESRSGIPSTTYEEVRTEYFLFRQESMDRGARTWVYRYHGESSWSRYLIGNLFSVFHSGPFILPRSKPSHSFQTDRFNLPTTKPPSSCFSDLSPSSPSWHPPLSQRPPRHRPTNLQQPQLSPAPQLPTLPQHQPPTHPKSPAPKSPQPTPPPPTPTPSSKLSTPMFSAGPLP